MKKQALLMGSLVAMAALTAACGQKQTTKSKTFSLMTTQTIGSMDPAQSTDNISGQAISDTMSGLYRVNGKSVDKDLAQKATVSKDQLTYTFDLRHDSKWSDGKAVTAKDFEYAWKRTVNPKTKSQYAYIYSGIKNADAIMANKKSADTLGVKATGKYTLTVKLEHALPYFKSLLTMPAFMPVEKSQVQKYGSTYGTKQKTLTFNGPYILKGWKSSNTTWKETKNKDYWNEKNVKITALNYQVVKDASTAMNLYHANKLQDIQISGNNATANQKSAAYNTDLSSSSTYLVPNANNVPAFKNAKIREALSLSIDRDAFIKKVLGDGSTSLSQLVPTKMQYNADKQDFATVASKKTDAYATYDLAKAKRLFKEGMKELNQTSLSFTLTGYDSSTSKATLEYVQSAFSNLSQDGASLKVTTQALPVQSALQLAAQHKTDMLVSTWGADFPDAISFLSLFTTDADYNFGQWSNTEYDKLIKASQTTDATNDAKRWDDMVKADQILGQNLGVIPMYQAGTAHLTKTSVKGLQYSSNSTVSYIGATVK